VISGVHVSVCTGVCVTAVVQVAEEIWVCKDMTATKWPGDIFSYKESLIKALEKEKAKKK
jgi:ATP-binding cassette, subfamily F, member 2